MKDGEIIEGYALSDTQYLAKIEKIKKSVDIPLSNCMYSDCTHKPIFSHVFQKESVLRNISTDGKVMAFTYRDLFTVLIDIFPYKGRTTIIIGFLEGEKNLWATEIYQMLRSDDLEDICIALQDILFRSEFHCMSKELYNEIESEIPLFLQEWEKLLGCHNYALSYKSNIFRKYIKKLLGYNSD